MEGQVIAGRYRLIRVLGKGGMGSVWLAEHLSLRTPIAVKLIHFEAAKNANARARFEREAQIVARIRSAHVVKVLDHGVTDAGLPYIAMECLVGESLRDRLQARGRLPLAATGKVISHLCRALGRAHEAGLVHRDLKPENIFIANEDDGEIIKILDFGVAKATDILSTAGMDPTRTGALLGTPYYMSPEQAQGLKTVDHRSDLWAVGVLAFECLTGKRPFTAPALGPLIAKIVAAPLPTLSATAPDAGIPAEVDAWLQKALARDPGARFSSAKELSDSFLVAAGVADTMDRSSALPAAAPPNMPAPHAPAPALPAPDLADNAATILLDSSAAAPPYAMPPQPTGGAAPPQAAPPPAAPVSPPGLPAAASPPAPATLAAPPPVVAVPAPARTSSLVFILIGLIVAALGIGVALAATLLR
jgi:serine/threonine protein kinase